MKQYKLVFKDGSSMNVGRRWQDALLDTWGRKTYRCLPNKEKIEVVESAVKTIQEIKTTTG